jgi:antitoxin component of RelBE/YafQ-DinJ toxin-antitoxin module
MTKDEAIKTLNREAWICCGEKWNEALDMGIEALAQTRWIPIEERLPEENQRVLIWCPEQKNIYCAVYKNKQWLGYNGIFLNKIEFQVITAWMPLPKPYMAEGV